MKYSRQAYLAAALALVLPTSALGQTQTDPNQLAQETMITDLHIDIPYRLTAHEGNTLMLRWLKSDGIKLKPVVKDVWVNALGTLRFFRDEHNNLAGYRLNEGRIRNLVFYKDVPPRAD